MKKQQLMLLALFLFLITSAYAETQSTGWGGFTNWGGVSAGAYYGFIFNNSIVHNNMTFLNMTWETAQGTPNPTHYKVFRNGNNAYIGETALIYSGNTVIFSIQPNLTNADSDIRILFTNPSSSWTFAYKPASDYINYNFGNFKEAGCFWNNGAGGCRTDEEYPLAKVGWQNWTVAPPESSNFSITANNTVTGSAITTFNATIDGILYATTTGTITTHILQNSTSLWDINLTAPNMYDVYLTQTNVSSNAVAQFTTGTIQVNSYTGYIAYNGINYIRNLSYSVTTNQCRGTPQLHRLINGVSENYTVVDCSLNTTTITGHYRAATEGFYNMSFLITGSTTIQANTSQTAFYEDLNNPTIVLLNHTFGQGFTTDLNVSVSMNCTDSYPNLNYSMFINANTLFKQNVTSGTLQTNTTILNDGATNLTAYCSDPFGTSTEQKQFIAYSKNFLLINEITGLPFVVSNITNAKIWFGDNSTYYDLKAHNVNNVSVLSSNISAMRIEIEYSTGDIVTRYLDMSLINEPTVYVCANTEGVIHYEQIAISSLTKPVIIKNIFSKCYIAADHTRFAYQNALILKSYSINSNYYIYTFDNGKQVTLASLDGSISTYINIDTLEFNKAGTTLTIQQDGLAFKKTGTSEVSIYYNNLGADNTEVNLSIYRQDTGELIYTQNDFTNKNEFTVIFDWASLTNVTKETLFKAELTKTNSQGTETFNRYFTTQGSTGFIPTGVGMAVSLLLVLFGLSWTASRITLSWFGIFICLAAIVILAFTTTAWYVKFLMFIEIIILVYCVIIMMKQNYGTVA